MFVPCWCTSRDEVAVDREADAGDFVFVSAGLLVDNEDVAVSLGATG